MPNFGNPTGSCVSARRREALVTWSHRAGVPLIEDDYGADLNLDGDSPPAALRALSSDVIYVATFSKKLIPALRVGFMVCPESLRKDLLPLKHTMDLGTSVLLQHALCEFLERGYLRAHLKRTVPEYRARRDALAGALAEGLPDDVEWTPPPRGLVLWLTLPEWMDPVAVYEETSRQGVLVTPGVLYSASGRDRHALRLAFCGEKPDRLVEGARRLCRALRELGAGRAAGRRAVARPMPLV
jgi:DNA-binding transcriptional MocR family regulator